MTDLATAPAPPDQEEASDRVEKMTAREVLDRLHSLFQAPSYANAEEVSDQAGFDGRGRCDFVSHGLWGSSGRKMIGVEVKVTRADWKRELAQPLKQAAFLQHLDAFYVAAPAGIVRAGELPEGWGHIIVSPGAERTRRQEATKPLHATPPTISREMHRTFIAAFLQAVTRTNDRRMEKGRREAVDRAIADERARLQRARLEGDAYWTRFATALQAEIGDQDRNTWHEVGFSSRDPEYMAGRMAAAVRAGMMGSWGLGPFDGAVKYADQAAEEMAATAKKLRDIGEAMGILAPLPPPSAAPKARRGRARA